MLVTVIVVAKGLWKEPKASGRNQEVGLGTKNILMAFVLKYPESEATISYLISAEFKLTAAGEN